jgi:uncharacterized lipoprotein YmbA
MTLRLARRALAPCVLACALGCLGGGPRPDFFTLSAAAGAEQIQPLARRPELGLAIGPIEFPRYLDRQEMVTRDGAHRLVLWNAHRWGGSLRTDILRTMATDLGALLGTARLAVYPAEARFPIDFRVLLEIVELDSVPGASVTLRARFTVASGTDGRAIVVEEVSFEEPVSSPAFEDLVSAQRAALGRVNREIAAKIASLSAQ